jgi:hypothetical protein
MAARDALPVFAPVAMCAGFALYACGSSDATLPPATVPDGAVGSGSDGSAVASSSGGSVSASSTTSGGTGASTSTGTSSSVAMSTSASANADDVLMYHKHVTRDGLYVDAAFTKAVVQNATLHLDASFAGTGINGQVRASPLYAESGYGGRPTFYVADESDNVYAFDANGAMLKTVNLGTGLTSEPCGVGYHVGIRGTPAIDTATGIMVLDAATGATSVAKHTIYGLKIADLSTAWSLDVSTLMSGTLAFAPSNENQRSAVLIVGGVAYVAYGGFIGDCGTYHGWVVGVSVATGTGAKAWATPAVEAGIWGPGGLSSDGTMVYAATGNPGTGATGWNGGFSLVRFASGPTFSGTTNDYWVAINDTADEDLGGSGPLLVNSGAKPYVVQLGKDGSEYLLDTTKALGGAVSPSLGSLKVMNDEIVGGPGWATIGGTTYVVMIANGAVGGANCPGGSSGQLVATKTDPSNAATPITMAWCTNPHGGGSPIITTSDGTNDAMVWTAGATVRNDGVGPNDNQMHAFDLATGAAVIAGSDPFVNVRHFTTPIVVHGRIFVAGDSRLYAYKP